MARLTCFGPPAQEACNHRYVRRPLIRHLQRLPHRWQGGLVLHLRCREVVRRGHAQVPGIVLPRRNALYHHVHRQGTSGA